jgi:flagellar assembly factor FliW
MQGMKCFNAQIGEIEYASEHIFTFSEGLIGFEQLRSFVVINDAETEPFRWLVSIEDEDVCLPILDPQLVVTNYQSLNAFPAGATVGVIASLKDPIEESTVNLRSPILFDAATRTAKQIILPDERFAIQHRFIGERALVAA